MHLRLLRLYALLLACLLGNHGALADYPIEVINLQSRSLEEVLPIVRPFAGGDGSVTGMGNHLIVKASPERLRGIKKLLEEIDLPPQRLLITLSNTDHEMSSTSGYKAGVDINSGNGRVSINSPEGPVDRTQGRISAHGSHEKATRNREQQVQALEGHPAYISAGISVPVHEQRLSNRSGIPHSHQNTGYRNVTGGFYVLPRLSGKFVTLQILQQNDRSGPARGIFHSQRTGTVVRGKLGEWIELGGIDLSAHNDRSGIAQSGKSSVSHTGGIRIKVECMECPD